MEDFRLRRLGMVMEPEPGNPNEVEGGRILRQLVARMERSISSQD